MFLLREVRRARAQAYSRAGCFHLRRLRRLVQPGPHRWGAPTTTPWLGSPNARAAVETPSDTADCLALTHFPYFDAQRNRGKNYRQ